MGLALLQAIETTKGKLPDVTKRAVASIVPRVQKNYSEITGVNRSEKFFYREGERDELRKTKFVSFADFYFATATANRQAGKLLETGFESCVAVVDAFLTNRRARDFWEIEESISNEMVRLRKAKISGDFVALLVAANRIEADIKELTRSMTLGAGAVN
ncbi:MAG TPA: hypothetical protein VIL74_08835 [Pyrinomonadaceae bacterium]|jgi:hypothetical protein